VHQDVKTRKMILVLTANSIRLAFSRESGNASAMGNMLKLIWWAVIGLFRSRSSLEAEILTLRHQLIVLRRKSPKRLAFSNFDRLVFAGLYWIAPGVVNALVIVEPETVIRWHRAPLPDTIERNLGRFDSRLGRLDDGARYRACPRTKPRPYGSCRAGDRLAAWPDRAFPWRHPHPRAGMK
jgi:hypothetical protein